MVSTWGCGLERIDSEDACAISSVSNNLPLPQPPQTTSRTPPTRRGSVSMTLPPEPPGLTPGVRRPGVCFGVCPLRFF